MHSDLLVSEVTYLRKFLALKSLDEGVVVGTIRVGAAQDGGLNHTATRLAQVLVMSVKDVNEVAVALF